MKFLIIVWSQDYVCDWCMYIYLCRYDRNLRLLSTSHRSLSNVCLTCLFFLFLSLAICLLVRAWSTFLWYTPFSNRRLLVSLLSDVGLEPTGLTWLRFVFGSCTWNLKSCLYRADWLARHQA